MAIYKNMGDIKKCVMTTIKGCHLVIKSVGCMKLSEIENVMPNFAEISHYAILEASSAK